MSLTEVVVQGNLDAEGVVHLDETPNLPPGRVTVVLRPEVPLSADDPFWQLLQEIWADQRARGHVPRRAEEVEAEREQVRQDWEQRMAEIDRIQEESRRLREQPS